MSNKSSQVKFFNRRVRRTKFCYGYNGARRLLVVLKIVLCMALAAATVIGCGWMGTEHSVRFNGWITEREMSRLPPLPTLANGLTENSAMRQLADDPEAEYEKGEQRTKDVDALWTEAEAAIERGDLVAIRELLRGYLDRTASRGYWTTDRQQRRNTAADQLDALAALDHGSRAPAVMAYLEARSAYDSWTADTTDAQSSQTLSQQGGESEAEQDSGSAENWADEARRALDAVPRDKNLEDNVAYLRAAILYREDKYTEAAHAFNILAARYPQSEKREAALFMAAVVKMKMSVLYTSASGDREHLREGGRQWDEAKKEYTIRPPTAVEPPDEAWREARAGFTRVMREFPRGRYTSDARGWLAHLLLRANDRTGALAEYYRLLGDERDENARIEAAFSLTMVRHHATDEEMRRVEAELEDEPSAALAYAYHNIYNYSIDPGCPLGPYDGYYPEDDWEAQRAEAKRRDLQRAEKERIVAFATRMMKRYPRAGVGGSFALRVAGANLELGNDRAALEQARRALSLGVRQDERGKALWVRGVAEHRLGDYAAARRTLTALVETEPHGKLVEGARRFIAMAAEDAGDLGAALEQYMALGYTSDVAYFIDVLMTPEQLKDFIERHPDSTRRDELLYSLSVRYLRLNRYQDARAILAQVRTIDRAGNQLDYSSSDDCTENYSRAVYNCTDPKKPAYDSSMMNVVRAKWVMRDLKTAADLERLEQAALMAQGDEAKAEALYQLASYLYESSELLFYNPAAWQGGRFYALYYDQKFRAPDEARIMRQYMEEHEPVVRALKIYLQIARLYPQTRAARDALYTAAVCHDRLAGFLLYWPAQYQMGLHPGERMVTYEDVRRTYPRYQLPRGTIGWKPSTRTVNGEPGWAAPPKPKPRPTWRARLKTELEKLLQRIVKFWEEKGRRWIIIGLAIVAAIFASRISARARKLLREQLKRQHLTQESPPESRGWLAVNQAEAIQAEMLDKWSARVRYKLRTIIDSWFRRAHSSWRLAFNACERPVLALNVITHALLVTLLLVLVRLMYLG